MKICLPLRAADVVSASRTGLSRRVRAAASQINLVEVWLDSCDSDDISEVIGKIRGLVGGKKPVIAVCKAPIEKGAFRGREKERIERLIKAAALPNRIQRQALVLANFSPIKGNNRPVSK